MFDGDAEGTELVVSFKRSGADDDAPERAIRGSTEEIADALARYDELGISHLIAHIFPRTPDSVARLGEAAALARERLAVPAG